MISFPPQYDELATLPAMVATALGLALFWGVVLEIAKKRIRDALPATEWWGRALEPTKSSECRSVGIDPICNQGSVSPEEAEGGGAQRDCRQEDDELDERQERRKVRLRSCIVYVFMRYVCSAAPTRWLSRGLLWLLLLRNA